MTFSVSVFRSVLLLAALALSGCLPSAQSPLDEEKEPHFLEGKSRVNAMDYKGAIESFEQALEVNPQSASAHFELGWLFDRKEPDPAAAIYHYEQYLKLRPNADKAEIVKQQIVNCKQELARTVSLGPITEKQQRDLDKLAEENKQLLEENKQLREEVAKWRAYYAGQPAPLTNQFAASLTGRSSSSSGGGQPNLTSSNSASSGRQTGVLASTHTHTIKPGETLTMVARRYGVRMDALLSANPRVNPRRLQPGQTLRIPSP